MERTWLNTSKFFCIAGVLFMLTATSCKKLVHVDEPDDSLSTTTVFSNDSLAQVAIAGLYIKIMNSPRFMLNGGMSLFPALSADELERTFLLNNEEQFASNAINSNNFLIYANLWRAAYFYVYNCNISIEGLQKSTGVTAAIKKRLTGEVQFVRALCYYYLVNLFGDVPLVLGTNADVNALLPRTSIDKVYLQMETDLVAASDALTGNQANKRPTSYAAQALLARVYLFMKKWSKAADLASGVINSGQFMLESDLNAVFKSNSHETIFQWVPVVDKMNAGEGFIFVPATTTGRPSYTLTFDLLNAFEPGDLRKVNWVKPMIFGNQPYNYPYKYKLYSSPSPPTEYNVVLRLAEQYLVRAEAMAQQDRIGDAVRDLNIIRTRAGLPGISTGISSEQCLQAIEQERRIELFAEWGHRWFDLKRTNRANMVLSNIKGSKWQTSDQLYPIPFSELEADPNLEQNPDYD
jgi:hypothetical protein